MPKDRTASILSKKRNVAYPTMLEFCREHRKDADAAAKKDKIGVREVLLILWDAAHPTEEAER